MARFLISGKNHHPVSRKTLDDLIAITAGQLRALGHHVITDNGEDNGDWKLIVGHDCYVVLYEGFTPMTAQMVKDGRDKGVNWIVIATEEPTEKGFNHGIDPLMVERQRMFVEVAPYLAGVVHLVSGQHVTDWFSRYLPAAQAELGYAPGLERFDRKEPDHEFGFYGGGVAKGTRRMRILQHLGRLTVAPNAVKVVTGYGMSVRDRDAAMRRSKLLLQIRMNDKMGLVSSSRCATSLYIGRPVVAEPHGLSWPWEDVIHFSKTLDEFYADALRLRGLWRGLHATQFARFKQMFTPEFCIGEPLRKIGVLKERIAA